MGYFMQLILGGKFVFVCFIVNHCKSLCIFPFFFGGCVCVCVVRGGGGGLI